MKVAIIIFIFLLTPFAVITLFRKYKIAKSIGTVIMAYFVGILLSFVFSFTNFLTSVEAESLDNIQKLLMNISVPLAIPLMLFSSDFRLWTKSLPKTMKALISGVAAVFIAVVVSFFIFKSTGIETIDKVSGMMAGFYLGGTMKFYAIGRALDINQSVILLTLTSEMLIMFPFLLFLVAGGYKLFRWLLPVKDDTTVEVHPTDSQSTTLAEVENYNGMFNKKVFPKTMIGLALSVCFLAVGAGLSLLIMPIIDPKADKLNELIIILTVTTLAIGASFFKKIRSLPRTFELGMFLILIFSVIVASQFDILKIGASALNIFFFVLSITLLSIILHVIISRIFKIPGDLSVVALIGLICSPPFVPPIVSAMGNRKVLISGIAVGLAGYALGTYFGILVSYLLGLF